MIGLTNKLIAAASFALVLLTLASSSVAAPPIGTAKARGDYRGFWDQQSSSQPMTMRRATPSFSTETRQSFSYEPSEQSQLSAQAEPAAKSGCDCGCGCG